MLPDPVNTAVDGAIPAMTFAVVKSDGYGTERVENLANVGISVITNHSKSKTGGNRHYLQFVWNIDAVDPYSGSTRKVQASASIAISRPVFGFTDTQMGNLVKMLTNYLYDSEVTPARLLQFQS